MEEKNFIKSCWDWIVNLFKGYWIGMEDLFLASWKKIVALLLLIVVPAIYGLSMSLAYWNPTENLHKVPIAILNDDYEYISISQTVQDGDTFSYKLGALTYDDGTIVGSKNETHQELIEKANQLNGTLTLNNGIKVNYDNSNTTVMVTSAWGEIKNLLTPKKEVKDESKTKYELKIAPTAELKFDNISYLNNRDDINNTWQTNKFQGQLKIDNGYGASYLGEIGKALANPKDLAPITFDDKENNLPKLNLFSTFQKNFVTGYLFNTFIKFKEFLTDQMMPYTNALKQNGDSVKRFGVIGKYLNEITNKNKFIDDQYYYILDADAFNKEFDSNLGQEYTLLGKNGKLDQYLNELTAMKNNKALQKIFPDQFKFISFLNTVAGEDKTKAINGFKSLIKGDSNSEDFKYLESNYKKIIIPILKGKLTPEQINNMPITLKEYGIAGKGNNYVGVNEDYNLNSYISAIMQLNDVNKVLFLNQPFLNILGTVYDTLTTKILTNNADLDKYKDTQIRAEQQGIYGIGLGSMFFIIGLFIGSTMLRGVISRNRQYSKLNFANWFISKFLIYATIGFVQVTLQVWIIYGAAWNSEISLQSMAFEYLWILQSELVLLAVIIGMQYAFSSPLVGGIIAILYLMFNISSGGGSYPAILQYEFFYDIHWLLPFTFILQGMDEINFGINIVGQNHFSTEYILQQWGICIAFFAFFMMVGLIGSYWRLRQVSYGSWKGRYVFEALMVMGRTEIASKFKTFKITNDNRKVVKYNWKVLASKFDPELYKTVRDQQRKKAGFKWYVEKRKKLAIQDNLNDR